MFHVQRRETFILLQEASSLKTKNKVWFILSPGVKVAWWRLLKWMALEIQNKIETFEMPHEELSVFHSGQKGWIFWWCPQAMENRNGVSTASSMSPLSEENLQSFGFSFPTIIQGIILQNRSPSISTERGWHGDTVPRKNQKMASILKEM